MFTEAKSGHVSSYREPWSRASKACQHQKACLGKHARRLRLKNAISAKDQQQEGIKGLGPRRAKAYDVAVIGYSLVGLVTAGQLAKMGKQVRPSLLYF